MPEAHGEGSAPAGPRSSAWWEPLLFLVLLWNALAGLVAMRLPTLYGDVSGPATGDIGWLPPLAPSMGAAACLCAIGLAGLYGWRRGVAAGPWLATLFYALQVAAVVAPVRFSLWTGLFAAIRLPLGSTSVVVVNVVSVALFVAHLRIALRRPSGAGSLARRIQAGVEPYRWVPLAVLHRVWGSPPLGRLAIAWRFAVIMSVLALMVPACAARFGSRVDWFATVMVWPVSVFVPTFALACVLAGQRQDDDGRMRRFSSRQGAATAFVTTTAALVTAFFVVRLPAGFGTPLLLVLMVPPMVAAMHGLGAVGGAWLRMRSRLPDVHGRKPFDWIEGIYTSYEAAGLILAIVPGLVLIWNA